MKNELEIVKALIREMNEELKGGQKKLDVAPPFGKLTGADFKKLRGVKKEDHEGTDHEVSMANNSLDSILWAVEELKKHLAGGERDIPAWIQDHITNAENYILQAAKNYHEYGAEEPTEEPTEEPADDMSLASLMEAKKKPSAGLSKKQKSAIVKKAKKGGDIGKKGKGFEKVVQAAKKGGARDPQAVAAAAMWKGAAKRAK